MDIKNEVSSVKNQCTKTSNHVSLITTVTTNVSKNHSKLENINTKIEKLASDVQTLRNQKVSSGTDKSCKEEFQKITTQCSNIENFMKENLTTEITSTKDLVKEGHGKSDNIIEAVQRMLPARGELQIKRFTKNFIYLVTV